MTLNQFEIYKNALVAKGQALSSGPGFREDITLERLPDMTDLLRQASDRDLAVIKLDQHAAELAEVRSALDRIEEGTYGRCLECGKRIPSNRLAAVPWAALCVRCQEAFDHPEPAVEEEQLTSA